MSTIKKIKDLNLDEILQLVADPERRRLHSEILKDLAAKNDSGYAWVDHVLDPPATVYDARAQMVEGVPFYILEDRRPFKEQIKIDVDAKYHEILRNLIAGQEIDYIDIGCADGSRVQRFTIVLGSYCTVRSTTAVDISSELIELARRNLPEARVEVADICDLSDEYTGRFGLVGCIFGVVGHVDEEKIPSAFTNLFKVAKDGGYVIIDVLTPEKGQTEKYIAYYPKAIDKDKDFITITDQNNVPLISTARSFSVEEMKQYAISAGFEIVEDLVLTPSSTEKERDYGTHYLMVLRRPETETKPK